MSLGEIRERLVEIAKQESNHSAAIQAMRLLRELDEEGDGKDQRDGKLYEAPALVRTKRQVAA